MVDVDLASGSALNKEVSRVEAGRSPHAQSSKRGLRSRLIAAAPYALIFAISAFLYHSAGQIDFDRVEGRIGPDFWPKLIIVLTMAACVWGAINAALLGGGGKAASASAPVSSAPDDSEIEAQDKPDPDEAEIYPWRIWGTIAGAVAYLLFMPYLGFFPSTVLFIAFVICTAGYRKIAPVLTLSLVGSLFFMTIFVRIVYVSLPMGIAPFDKISIALMKIINL
jgi:putative tricarboxylic transport membrane protein